jgi:hypothetical protein
MPTVETLLEVALRNVMIEMLPQRVLLELADPPQHREPVIANTDKANRVCKRHRKCSRDNLNILFFSWDRAPRLIWTLWKR